jgi:hypothetical protein
MFEFDGGILSREAPGDGDLLLITPSCPGSHLLFSFLRGTNRCDKHCRSSAESSISAMFGQLACLGV